MSTGFVKFQRTNESKDLLQYKNELALLAFIALHARYSESTVGDLQKGECFISAQSVQLSQRQYRTAKKRLEDWGLATFKATNRCTIAKIESTSVFDVFNSANDKPNDKQKTSKRSTTKLTDQYEWLLDVFNESKTKQRGRKSTHKALTQIAKNNFKKLWKLGYREDDFKAAINTMLKADWPKKSGNDTPEHVLRNENFIRYLNKSETKSKQNGIDKKDKYEEILHGRSER